MVPFTKSFTSLVIAASKPTRYLLTHTHNVGTQVNASHAEHAQQQAAVLALQGDLSSHETKCEEYATQLQDITNRLHTAGVTQQVVFAACVCVCVFVKTRVPT